MVGGTGLAAGSHEVEAGEGCEGSDENATGLAFRFGDDVEAFVDAVGEIHVSVAWWSEDDAGSFGEPGGGMGGEVMMTQVGFCFDDQAGAFSMGEDFAEEVAGDFDGGSCVEMSREDHACFLVKSIPLHSLLTEQIL